MNLIYLHIGDYSQATARLTPEQDGIYFRLLMEYYKTEKPPVDDIKKLAFLTGCSTKKLQAELEFVLEMFFVHAPAKKCWLHKRVEKEIANFKADCVQKRYAILCRHWEKANSGVKRPTYEEFAANPSRYYDDTTNRIRIVTGRIPLVLESYGDGSTETPSPNYAPGTRNQEPVTGNQEPENTPVVPKGTPPLEALAEAIYAAYPRKVGKPVAIRAIVKVLKSGTITELELQRLVGEYARAVEKWPPEARYTREGNDTVPHPSTWFNQRRFEDDAATWTREPARTPEKKERGGAAPLSFDDAPQGEDDAPPDWRLMWGGVFTGPCPDVWEDVPSVNQRRILAEIAEKKRGGAARG